MQTEPKRFHLTDEQVDQNEYLADAAPDSTPDGGKRPPTTKPRIINTDEIVDSEEPEEYPR